MKFSWERVPGRGGRHYTDRQRLQMVLLRMQGQDVEAVAKEAGCSEGVVTRSTAEMVEQGYATNPKRGKFNLTKKGRELLEADNKPTAKVVQNGKATEIHVTPAPRLPKVEKTLSAKVNNRVRQLEEEVFYQKQLVRILVNQKLADRLARDLHDLKKLRGQS